MQTTGMRKFGGRYYYLKATARTKTEARKIAGKVRRGGLHDVRIAPIKGGYGLFLRTIGVKEPSKAEIRELKKIRG